VDQRDVTVHIEKRIPVLHATVPLCNIVILRLTKTQNKTKQNKTKQNKTKQNKTKQNKTKQNKTKQNKQKVKWAIGYFIKSEKGTWRTYVAIVT
jgi:hypothetical protein